MQQTYAPSVQLYAGFWRRFVASIIDGAVISIPAGILGGIFGAAIGAASNSGSTAATGLATGVGLIIEILALVGSILYYSLMESSANQATLGKMAMGIVVTDLNGQRISFGRAIGRYFGKFVSAIICYIGFIMAAFTQRKQALHDMMAGTLVVRKEAVGAISGQGYSPYGTPPPPPPTSYAPPPPQPSYAPPPPAAPPPL
ncbi:MAG TPA: RDD family protein, partial [Candidatus Dormibacteraeota bacterium]